MALEEFFKDNSQLKDVCLKATEGVEAACSEGKDTKAESMKQANSTIPEALTTAEVNHSIPEMEGTEIPECNVQGHDELPTLCGNNPVLHSGNLEC